MAFEDDTAPITERTPGMDGTSPALPERGRDMEPMAGQLYADALEDEFFSAPIVPRATKRVEEEDSYDPLMMLKMSASVRARRARLARLVMAVMAFAAVLCVMAFGVEALAGPTTGGHRQPSLEKSAMRNMHSAPYDRSSRR